MILGRQQKPRPEAPEPEGRGGWFARLRAGLGLSKDKIAEGIDAVIAEGAPTDGDTPAKPEAPPPPRAPVPEAPKTPEIEPAAPEAPAPEAPETPEAEPAAPDAPAPAAPEAPEVEPARRRGLAERLVRAVTRRRLDEVALEALEDVLITADLGPATAARLTGNLARSKFDKDVTGEEVRAALAADIEAILAPMAQPLVLDAAARPHVILVVGVNGTGKTTTIGKLGKRLGEDGRAVMFCAGDTFRAAAIEQLKVWGERAGAPVVARAQGADSAGLAYDALERARAEGVDALLIDTAGRLHNRADLMAELEKIIRVLKKLDPAAPHSCLLVLDATTGQNAHAQVQTFQEMTHVTGLVVTKLDGSARGGVIVGLADRFGLPVHAVGVGEGIDDLRPFGAREFARSLMGLDG